VPTAAQALIVEALERSPLDDASPVATWTVVDLRELLAQRGWERSRETVSRTVHRLGVV